MQIENRFELPLAPEAAWPLLMDVPRTAAAFPGASDIEVLAPDQYKGRITVKLGPLTMVFAGKLILAECDNEARSARVKAQWSEVKGRGNATTETCFSLAPSVRGSEAQLQTTLQLAGQVAQYGRAAGLLQALSAELVNQFARRLRESISSGAIPAPQKALSAVALAAQALGARLRN
jgi:carbon monoxide dehydrogenase subunit G